MIEHRPFNELGGEDHGWLKAKHHFSFADYVDPARIGWGSLRVWNDDEIAPNTGFPPHPHANMEIITYVRKGAVTHKDSLGNEGRTEAGDVQVMSAGAGIRHAEYNLEQRPTRIFQIWIIPSSKGGSPAWGSQPFPKADRSGRFVTLASGFDNDKDALPIRARARVLGAMLKRNRRICTWRTTLWLPGACFGRHRGQRPEDRCSRRRRHQRCRCRQDHGNRRFRGRNGRRAVAQGGAPGANPSRRR